jgi:ankyrin repeat protein
LPALVSKDWEKPSVFLNAIRSDLAFMEYLKLIDAQQFERFEAAAPRDLFPLIHLLLLNGLDVNNSKFKSVSGPRKGAMPLYQTLGWDWTKTPELNDIGKLLLGYGAQYDCLVDLNYGCITVACCREDDELVDIMLNLDIHNINWILNDMGRTPIHLAAKNGRLKTVSVLIKHGTDFRSSEKSHNAATLAACNGHVGVIKVLVEHGMNVDERTRGLADTPMQLGMKRPIHYAAECGKTEVVKYLLEKGADPTRRFGTISKLLPSATPYRLAMKNGHEETARILERAAREWKRKG